MWLELPQSGFSRAESVLTNEEAAVFQDAGSWTRALAGGQPHMLLPAGPLRAIHPQVGPVSSLASTLVAQGTGQNCMCTCSICCTPPRAPASAGLPEVILEQESTPTYTGHPGTASTPHSGTPQHCQYPTFKDTPTLPVPHLQGHPGTASPRTANSPGVTWTLTGLT